MYYGMLYSDLIVIIVIATIAIYLGALLVIAEAATNRGRTGVGWFLFGILLTPIAAAILLICVGEKSEARRNRIIEEEELRQSVARKYATQQPSEPEDNAISTAKTINDIYR